MAEVLCWDQGSQLHQLTRGGKSVVIKWSPLCAVESAQVLILFSSVFFWIAAHRWQCFYSVQFTQLKMSTGGTMDIQYLS